MASDRLLTDGKLDGGGGDEAADVAEVGGVGAGAGLLATVVGTGTRFETGVGEFAAEEAAEGVVGADVVIGETGDDAETGAGHGGGALGDGDAALDEGGEAFLR